MSDRLSLLRNAYGKLDSMPLSFGLTGEDDALENEIGQQLNDTLRELKISDASSIEPDSNFEYYFEVRMVYHILRRFRNSASVNFKYSTGNEGESVDKSMIPKMIKTMIDEYDDEFRSWRRNSYTGGIWHKTRGDD